MGNYFDSRDILRITDKLQDEIEDLKCDLEFCCSKHPVNCGDGIGIYKDYSHGHWNFKSLVAGDNIIIEDEGCEIVISATAEPFTCEDVDDCLGISPEAPSGEVLNHQGNWIPMTGGGGGSFTCSDLLSCSTTNLPEGSNLYFTDARAIAALTGQNISIFNNDAGYVTCSDVNGCITGDPTEVLYYDAGGNLTSDSDFSRVPGGVLPRTYIASVHSLSNQTSYLELRHSSVDLYNDFTGLNDGSKLYLNHSVSIGTVQGSLLDSYIFINSSNFIYNNTSLGTVLTYPNVDGNNGDVLTTDGAGNITFQPIPAGFITAIADTNTVDLVEAAGTLTANVRHQDTTDIDLSDDASGLKADLTTTGVVANTYGDASNVAQITVDSKGRITTAVEVEIDCTDDFIKGYRAMGSVIKAQKLGMTIQQITASTNLSDQQLLWNAVYICNTTTISGAMWYQSVQGSYTANNYNGVGLYSYSGGTLTLVASSTDDGNIWKAAANTYGTKAFSASYAASPGIYFVAFLYCRSAQVTAPAIGSSPVVANAGVWALDFTNSIRPYLFLNAQTALPTPILASATGGAGTSNIWVGIY